MSTQVAYVLAVEITEEGKKRQGFASMSLERRKELASLGGKAAHAQGKAHKWTPEEASIAGKRGGTISRRRPKSAAQD